MTAGFLSGDASFTASRLQHGGAGDGGVDPNDRAVGWIAGSSAIGAAPSSSSWSSTRGPGRLLAPDLGVFNFDIASANVSGAAAFPVATVASLPGLGRLLAPGWVVFNFDIASANVSGAAAFPVATVASLPDLGRLLAPGWAVCNVETASAEDCIAVVESRRRLEICTEESL